MGRMSRTPLYGLHQRRGAVFHRVGEWELPLHYGDTEAEYRALTQGVGLVDHSFQGRIRAYGKDALDLLNRLSTNKLETLPQGTGAATILTTNKGRVIDLLLVEAMADHLLMLTSPQQRQRILEWVDFYTFSEDAHLEDVTDEEVMVSVVGPQAPQVVHALSGTDAASLDRFHWVSTQVAGIQMPLLRTDLAGVPQYNLLAPASQAEAFWQAVLEAGEIHNITPVGSSALEALRVEQGIPSYGAELSEELNPLEARLLGFISFSKGCYIGQEVVTRLNTYQKVQRQLMGIALEEEAAVGDNVEQEGQPVGAITSVAWLPGKGWRALAYIRHAQIKAGAQIRVAGTQVVGELYHPPFALATEPVNV